jgi:Transposase DDE domain group 1
VRCSPIRLRFATRQRAQRRWLGGRAQAILRYRGRVWSIYFRADAAFAMPGVHEYLEAEHIKYAIRLPANQVLQNRIGYLLKRPVGRPPNEVRRYYANFTYQAASWSKPRRVIAKVEWHPGELYPRVGFVVTNMSRPAERVVAFYNKRGRAEQWIKEGKGAIKWTRLSCRTFAANAVRLQLHALAYNLGNFLRTLATPEPIKDWSLSSLKEKLIKIGAKVVSHGLSPIALCGLTSLYSIRHSSTFSRASSRSRNQWRPRHSSRRSVGFPGRLKSSVTPFAYAHRSSSFEVNCPWSTRIVVGKPCCRRACSSASITSMAVADRHTRMTGHIRLQVSVLLGLTSHLDQSGGPIILRQYDAGDDWRDRATCPAGWPNQN